MRTGYDGAKRRKGARVHAPLDTLGHLLALHVTPADEHNWAQVEQFAQAVQDVAGYGVQPACVDQGSREVKAELIFLLPVRAHRSFAFATSQDVAARRGSACRIRTGISSIWTVFAPQAC